MTDRILTTIAIRFAALLLFTEIFEKFYAYFWTVYYTVSITFMEERLHTSFDKFYYSGTFLIIANIIVSCLLFFKAEWIALKLIKKDSTINIEITPEKLIKVILLTTGIIWLAQTVYLFFSDLYDYIQMTIASNKNVEHKRVDFALPYYIMKFLIALFFIFRVDKISLFLEKKMNNSDTREIPPINDNAG